MAVQKFYALIMAGGSGERFWPMSRHRRPKHALGIVGKGAMIAQTVARLKGLIPPERVLVLTQSYQLSILRQLCPQIPAANFYAEPMRRDTAAAVALAGVLIGKKDPDAVFAILPADAYVRDTMAFKKSLKEALLCAAEGKHIVTIGIPPNRPATAYGYLQTGKPATATGQALCVKRFVEKPDESTAKKYLAQGGFYWNAGIFAWSLPVLRAAFEQHCPSLAHAIGALAHSRHFARDLKAVYPTLERISVDYAVMEKADNIVMIPAAFDWDDVGEWTSVARHHTADLNGNIVAGNAVLHKSTGNIVYGDKKHLIALCGVENLVVVHTEDATFVCDKNKIGELKQLLAAIPEKHR